MCASGASKRIKAMRKFKRGLMIDADGFIAGAFRYERGDKLPVPLPGHSLIVNREAVRAATPRSRWNETAKRWELPTEVRHFYDEDTGAYRGSRRVWPDRDALPDGVEATTVQPRTRRERQFFDPERQRWLSPRVAVIKDAVTGEVINRVLESPMAGGFEVPVPEGQTKEYE